MFKKLFSKGEKPMQLNQEIEKYLSEYRSECFPDGVLTSVLDFNISIADRTEY